MITVTFCRLLIKMYGLFQRGSRPFALSVEELSRLIAIPDRLWVFPTPCSVPLFPGSVDGCSWLSTIYIWPRALSVFGDLHEHSHIT
jgi:hypothetical protein